MMPTENRSSTYGWKTRLWILSRINSRINRRQEVDVVVRRVGAITEVEAIGVEGVEEVIVAGAAVVVVNKEKTVRDRH